MYVHGIIVRGTDISGYGAGTPNRLLEDKAIDLAMLSLGQFDVRYIEVYKYKYAELHALVFLNGSEEKKQQFEDWMDEKDWQVWSAGKNHHSPAEAINICNNRDDIENEDSCLNTIINADWRIIFYQKMDREKTQDVNYNDDGGQIENKILHIEYPMQDAMNNTKQKILEVFHK